MGGGESTNTVQQSDVQKAQGDILKQLSPDLLTFMQGQLRGLNSVNPQLTQMLQQSTGQGITPGMQQTLTGIQQQMRQQSAQAGIAPGDPRLASSISKMGEVGTKASLPEIQTIMSMFGTNPQNTLSQMGAGGPAGTKSEFDPSTASQVGQGLGAAATIAMLAYIIM